jgi:uncharacterized membrane protein (UPF0127 family)
MTDPLDPSCDRHPARRPPTGRGARARPALRRKLAAFATAALCGLAPAATALAQASPERPAPQPTLPRVDIQAGMHVIRAEVAADGPSRTRGLMMRERLGQNEGMLFVFEQKAGHCFWMKNTLIPLSIAFLDDDGTIANILDMKPHDESSHCPVRPVRYALEMEQGWFARRGLKAGVRLSQPQLFRGPAN